MHEVGLHIEAGFAAAGASDHQHILVPGCFGVFGPPGHGQAFGLGQQDVVFKLGVDVGGNVLGGAPSGRAVFFTLAVLLGILAFAVHDEPDSHRPGNAHAQVKRMQAGQRVCKGGGDAARQVEQLCRSIRARSQTVRLPAFGEQVHEQQIRQIQQQQLFQFRLHRSSPLCLIFSFARFGCWAAFCLAAASTLRIEGRCSLVSVLAVNSRNACSRLSASLALKITM